MQNNALQTALTKEAWYGAHRVNLYFRIDICSVTVAYR
jgi:hypothetical protein